KKRMLVVAVRIIRAAIEPGGNHGPEKSYPTAHLPEIDLQGGKIAEADNAFRNLQMGAEVVVENVVCAVAAAQRHKTGDFRVARGFEEALASGFRGSSEITFRAGQLHGNKFVTEAAKLG